MTVTDVRRKNFDTCPKPMPPPWLIWVIMLTAANTSGLLRRLARLPLPMASLPLYPPRCPPGRPDESSRSSRRSRRRSASWPRSSSWEAPRSKLACDQKEFSNRKHILHLKDINFTLCRSRLMLMRDLARATESGFPVMLICRSSSAAVAGSSLRLILIIAPDICL